MESGAIVTGTALAEPEPGWEQARAKAIGTNNKSRNRMPGADIMDGAS